MRTQWKIWHKQPMTWSGGLNWTKADVTLVKLNIVMSAFLHSLSHCGVNAEYFSDFIDIIGTSLNRLRPTILHKVICSTLRRSPRCTSAPKKNEDSRIQNMWKMVVWSTNESVGCLSAYTKHEIESDNTHTCAGDCVCVYDTVELVFLYNRTAFVCPECAEKLAS